MTQDEGLSAVVRTTSKHCYQRIFAVPRIIAVRAAALTSQMGKKKPTVLISPHTTVFCMTILVYLAQTH